MTEKKKEEYQPSSARCTHSLPSMPQYPIVKILAHNHLQECRRTFKQKESESSEIEIVQQERVKLSIITLLKDYLALTVQYFHFQCNNILYTVFVNERYKILSY